MPPTLATHTHTHTQTQTCMHTHCDTHSSELHATAVSAFRALYGTMGALVFLNTMDPCDESSLRENMRDRDIQTFVCVTLETLVELKLVCMWMDKDGHKHNRMSYPHVPMRLDTCKSL